MLLKEKNIVITGASRGLGKAIAQACWTHGANLLLAARSKAALEAQRSEFLRTPVREKQIAEICAADLSKHTAVETITSKALGYFSAAHGLINNAGILGPIGKSWENNWRDWEATIRVDLLAPIELCRAFAPWMIQTGGGSIVNLSGGGATGPRPNFTAYATAKTGLVRFSEILAHELKSTGVRVNSVAPGAMATDMLKEILDAGPDKVGADEFNKVLAQSRSGGTPPERAAELCAFLCSDRAKEITGRLLAAAWDPWEKLEARADELNASDVYTLRRIVPEDRGKKWGN
jgi:NAD(P)-dependent dehydrogenase (short-subunit alcohol dehydrogenase family)